METLPGALDWQWHVVRSVRAEALVPGHPALGLGKPGWARAGLEPVPSQSRHGIQDSRDFREAQTKTLSFATVAGKVLDSQARQTRRRRTRSADFPAQDRDQDRQESRDQSRAGRENRSYPLLPAAL